MAALRFENHYEDRREAGRMLAEELLAYARGPDVLVLALPRGGVPVGYEVAARLGVPLDVFVVRKLGVPGREELALGAIASGGARVLSRDVVEGLEIPDAVIESVTARETLELERRERLYRGGRPALDVAGATVILVDDGLATGASMRVAVAAVKRLGPARIVVAVPVSSPDVCDEIAGLVDEAVCARTPSPFRSVGRWFRDFRQTTDEEVRALLASKIPAGADLHEAAPRDSHRPR